MAPVNRERLKDLFLELVRVDSPSRRERKVALTIKRKLERMGAACRFDEAGEKVGGDTGNLIAHLDAAGTDAPALLLSAHMDTVEPGEGVKPVVAGDIIRSDGTTVLGGDDKSGCAVILEVLHQIRERKIPHGPIDCVFTICEEVGLLGAKFLNLRLVRAREGLVFDGDSPDRLFVRAPGAHVMRFTVKGLEAHAGVCPERGISAIQIAARAIAAMRLGRIDQETTANLGIIGGGRATNIIPNQVTIHGEARSHNARKLKRQVEHMVGCFKQAVARASVKLDGRRARAELDYEAAPQYEAMNLPDATPIVRKVVEAAARAGKLIEPATMGGGCDANVLNRRGLSVANLGTGMREVHTVREWLDLNDMVSAAEVTLELIKLQAEG
jgi:tripeptide aminopeptidase